MTHRLTPIRCQPKMESAYEILQCSRGAEFECGAWDAAHQHLAVMATERPFVSVHLPEEKDA